MLAEFQGIVGDGVNLVITELVEHSPSICEVKTPLAQAALAQDDAVVAEVQMIARRQLGYHLARRGVAFNLRNSNIAGCVSR